MGVSQVKNFLLSLLHLFKTNHARLIEEVRREFGFLMKGYGYDLRYCAYMNAMYWVIELWSAEEHLGINISCEMGIAVFVVIPEYFDNKRGKFYLYLPAMISYLTGDTRFIEMERTGKIPLIQGALRWHARLLRDYYPLVAAALRTKKKRKEIVEKYIEYLRQYENGSLGLHKLAPIDFEIGEGWEFKDPCWVRKR